MALNFANNNSLSAITSLPASISGGTFNLLQTQTASSSATISFTSNIDSTYDAYMFKLYNIHPQTDNKIFQVNFRDGGSSYDATKTTTVFRTQHTEDGSANNFGYMADYDLAQSTAVQQLLDGTGNDNDQSLSGEMYLFDPSSTTFVKHFTSTANSTHTGGGNPFTSNSFVSGYFNTTSAIDAIQFKQSSGNIDAGDICLYGIL